MVPLIPWAFHLRVSTCRQGPEHCTGNAGPASDTCVIGESGPSCDLKCSTGPGTRFAARWHAASSPISRTVGATTTEQRNVNAAFSTSSVIVNAFEEHHTRKCLKQTGRMSLTRQRKSYQSICYCVHSSAAIASCDYHHYNITSLQALVVVLSLMYCISCILYSDNHRQFTDNAYEL